MEILELTTKTEMLNQFPIIKELYPDFTMQKYESLLDEMLPINYKQLIVKENEQTIAFA